MLTFKQIVYYSWSHSRIYPAPQRANLALSDHLAIGALVVSSRVWSTEGGNVTRNRSINKPTNNVDRWYSPAFRRCLLLIISLLFSGICSDGSARRAAITINIRRRRRRLYSNGRCYSTFRARNSRDGGRVTDDHQTHRSDGQKHTEWIRYQLWRLAHINNNIAILLCFPFHSTQVVALHKY